MPRFLNTRGNPTLGIGICGRCSFKFPLHKLQPDPNSPGLMVCDKDRDEYDPWRLPARAPDQIALPFTRPDTPLSAGPVASATARTPAWDFSEASDFTLNVWTGVA